MFSFKKALALAGAAAVLSGLGLTAVPAQASSTETPTVVVAGDDKAATIQEGGGDVGFVKNSKYSHRQIRVWKDDNCPNTLEGFRRSDVVYEGEWAAFPSVGSVWMAKDRVLTSSYWLQKWKTNEQGRCINLTVSPSTVLRYTINNSN